MTPQPHAEIWNRNFTEVLIRKGQAQLHQIHGFSSILVVNTNFSTCMYFCIRRALLFGCIIFCMSLPLDTMLQM